MLRVVTALLACLAFAVVVSGAQLPSALRSARPSLAAADSTAPTTTVGTPASCPHDAGAGVTVAVSITAADNVAVSHVLWANTESAGSGTLSGTTTATGTIALVNGDNTLSFTAVDTTGNADASPATCVVTSTGGGSFLFSTTFATADCPDWTNSGEVCQVNDGIAFSDAGTAGLSSWVNAASNFGNGGGGKGYSMERLDGVNQLGPGIAINLTNVYSEIYGRYYMKFESGFGWLPVGAPHYSKDVYVDCCNNAARPIVIFGWSQCSTYGIYPTGTGECGNTATPLSWATAMGGNTGDGLFHCYEFRLKMDTNGANGIRTMKVDGVTTFSHTTTNFQSATITNDGWTKFQFGNNQSRIDNDQDGDGLASDSDAPRYRTFYDDFAFSTTGFPGCPYTNGA